MYNRVAFFVFLHKILIQLFRIQVEYMDIIRPKISVLIPVYNVEKYLARCLDSVLGQSLKDIEVICVDDASPDNSAQILRHYAERDSRVRIITKLRNEGLMMARKTGYENATGEFFFFVDSDDYITENALEILYKAALKDNADVTVGDFYFERGSRKVLMHRAAGLSTDPKFFLLAMMNGGMCSLCGTLYHRGLFEGKEYHSFMNHSFAEDRMLNLQLLPNAHRLKAVEYPTFVYFLNEGGMTSGRLTEKKLLEIIKAQVWCLERSLQTDEFKYPATRLFIRSVSFLIESGYDSALFESYAPIVGEMLEFRNMREYVGLRLACHTWLCKKLLIYRKFASASRRVLQTILGRRR